VWHEILCLRFGVCCITATDTKVFYIITLGSIGVLFY
jgi:hypothetical protein